MIKDRNVCVRVERDALQIAKCKSKLKEISIPITSLSRLIRLVGNEVRMKILYLLRQEGRLCVCDLSEILEMKIPAISQHLRKMKDAELVFPEREGATIYYHISPSLKSQIDIVYSLLPEPQTV